MRRQDMRRQDMIKSFKTFGYIGVFMIYLLAFMTAVKNDGAYMFLCILWLINLFVCMSNIREYDKENNQNRSEI